MKILTNTHDTNTIEFDVKFWNSPTIDDVKDYFIDEEDYLDWWDWHEGRLLEELFIEAKKLKIEGYTIEDVGMLGRSDGWFAIYTEEDPADIDVKLLEPVIDWIEDKKKNWFDICMNYIKENKAPVYKLKEGDRVYATGVSLTLQFDDGRPYWIVDGFEDDVYFDGETVNYDDEIGYYITKKKRAW